MMTVVWILFAFFCGSLPLSVWLGNVALGIDIRQVGDGNPGASNVWRAGGPVWGVLAILLDFAKGAIPVALANFAFDIDGPALILVAVAPIAGHAFSPFLGLHGGKALAVSFGVWAGLTTWVGPMALGIFMAVFLWFIEPEGWAVVAGTLGLLLALIKLNADAGLYFVWLSMTLIMILKQKDDLRERPRLRAHGTDRRQP